jgi:hypothetical protein
MSHLDWMVSTLCSSLNAVLKRIGNNLNCFGQNVQQIANIACLTLLNCKKLVLTLQVPEQNARQMTHALTENIGVNHYILKETHLFSKKGFGRPVERASGFLCFLNRPINH